MKCNYCKNEFSTKEFSRHYDDCRENHFVTYYRKEYEERCKGRVYGKNHT